MWCARRYQCPSPALLACYHPSLPPPPPNTTTQDIGAVELIRRVAPSLPVHGSTQMSITSAPGAAFAAGRGVERVVVGRELSVQEIGRVAQGAGEACRGWGWRG